jgi:hypothetical protein
MQTISNVLRPRSDPRFPQQIKGNNMAEYETEIQWGGPKAPLHVDADQEINIPDREEVTDLLK